MILALSPKTDYTASLQLRSLGNNEPRISSMNVIDIAEGYQVRMGLGHRWRKHYIHGAILLYSSEYNNLNNENQSQSTLGGRYEYKRNRQENVYVLARYRRSLDIESTLHHILIRCKWTKRYQDDFSFHCYLSTQAQKIQSMVMGPTLVYRSAIQSLENHSTSSSTIVLHPYRTRCIARLSLYHISSLWIPSSI